MFADLAGSTRLYDIFGDAKAKLLVDECLELMRSVVGQCGGEVIKTIGDELMCVLPDAENAWRAAVDIQLRVADLPQVEGHKRSIRIGFHVGFVIRTSTDVFGDTVNMAARMTSLAKGGQIMATCATVMQLPKILRTATRKIAALSIKGKDESVAVCEIIWQTSDDLTMATPSVAVMQRQVQLNLQFRGDTYFMNQLCPRIMMGRDLSCNFVVSDKMASRQHAFIELRQEKFFLIDQSTNGTFVHPDGETELLLRREEMVLQGTGVIGFGRSVELAEGDQVRFSVVEA